MITATRIFPSREGGLPTQQVIDHFSVDDRQHGMKFPDRFVGNLYRIEIIVAQYHQVAEFAHFYRAKVGLLLEEPPVVHGVQADRLFARGAVPD